MKKKLLPAAVISIVVLAAISLIHFMWPVAPAQQEPLASALPILLTLCMSGFIVFGAGSMLAGEELPVHRLPFLALWLAWEVILGRVADLSFGNQVLAAVAADSFLVASWFFMKHFSFYDDTTKAITA